LSEPRNDTVMLMHSLREVQMNNAVTDLLETTPYTAVSLWHLTRII